MSTAQAEYDRKYMMRVGGGRQELRIWARFPSSVERNDCYERMNERDGDGRWKSNVTYDGATVEVWRPDTRDNKFMMRKRAVETPIGPHTYQRYIIEKVCQEENLCQVHR